MLRARLLRGGVKPQIYIYFFFQTKFSCPSGPGPPRGPGEVLPKSLASASMRLTKRVRHVKQTSLK